MNAKHPLVIAILTILVIVLTSCAGASPAPQINPSKILKFSVTANETSSWFTCGSKFAELVKQRTNGRIGVSVFANASLAGGDQTREIQMLKDGGIDMALIPDAVYDRFDPRFDASLLPWLLPSNADVDKAFAGPLGQELFRLLEAGNIVGLAYAENGFRQITNSKREIKTPADVKDLKIRVVTNMHGSTLTLLGATTQIMNLTALYDALKNNVVDGQENSVSLIVGNKFHEVQKYVTLWNYSYGMLMVGINKNVWDSFDPDTQKIIRQAAQDAAKFQIQQSRSETDSQIQMLKDKGVKVTTLTPEQIQAFKALVAPIYADQEKIVGKEFMDKFITPLR